jgi:ribosome-associated heat shock protein Hsp15
LDRIVRVLRVVGFAERRGSADEARALCAPLEPVPAQQPMERATSPGLREPGSGRPTKQERRAINRLRDEEQE